MGRPREKNKHLPKYVVERHGAYWYGPPKMKAVRVCEIGNFMALYKFLADKHAPARLATTIGDLLDRYAREVVPGLAPRTQKDYHRHIQRLKTWCGHMHPDDLTNEDVGRFLRPEGYQTRGGVHRNRTIGVLSAMLTIAMKRWYVKIQNPCKFAERNDTQPRSRYITDAEFAIVRAAMPVRIQIAMDLALLTGQRQGDLLSLKWQHVSAEGVFFAPAKTQKKVGKRLLVSMSPDLEAVLTRAKKLLPDLPREFVLRTRDGERYTSEGFRAVWQRRMRKLCSGYWRKARGKEKVRIEAVLAERFTFHDIRAKCVSDSGSLEEAFGRAGHTSMQMTRSVYDRGIRKVTPLR